MTAAGYYFFDGANWQHLQDTPNKFIDGSNPTNQAYYNGNVGIGILDPQANLDVKSKIKVTAAATTTNASLAIESLDLNRNTGFYFHNTPENLVNPEDKVLRSYFGRSYRGGWSYNRFSL